MKKYSGQALAIVFVLLIVGSIIGFALYARMIRESERVVDEKSSAEANELVESTIGLISTLGYDQIKDEDVLSQIDCIEMDLQSDGCRANNLTLTEMENLLDSMGLEDIDLSGFEHDSQEDYCLSELALYSLSSEGVTIDKDYAYSVFLNNPGSLEDCNMEFSMDNIESSTTGFVMSTFYAQVDANNELIAYKPYHFEDITGFLYGSESRDNWEGYVPKTNLRFSSEGPYTLRKDIDGTDYRINEIRFKSLGGSSKLAWSSNSSCNLEDPILIEVGATCGGSYIGKNFIMPEEYFAPPMFDYVYFQGQGNLEVDDD